MGLVACDDVASGWGSLCVCAWRCRSRGVLAFRTCCSYLSYYVMVQALRVKDTNILSSCLSVSIVYQTLCLILPLNVREVFQHAHQFLYINHDSIWGPVPPNFNVSVTMPTRLLGALIAIKISVSVLYMHMSTVSASRKCVSDMPMVFSLG